MTSFVDYIDSIKLCFEPDGTITMDFPCDPSTNVGTVVLSPLKPYINPVYNLGQRLLWNWEPVYHELVLRYAPKYSGRGHLHRYQLGRRCVSLFAESVLWFSSRSFLVLISRHVLDKLKKYDLSTTISIPPTVPPTTKDVPAHRATLAAIWKGG